MSSSAAVSSAAVPSAEAEVSSRPYDSTRVLTVSIKVPFECHALSEVRIACTPIAGEEFNIRCRVSHEPSKCGHAAPSSTVFVYEEMDEEALVRKIRNIYELVQPTEASIEYQGESFTYGILQVIKHERDTASLSDDYYEMADREDVDWDVERFCDFIVARVRRFSKPMGASSEHMYAVELLKGKECPVMLEPLEPGKTYRLACKHLLSSTAWHKQKGTKCPMCRGEGAPAKFMM